MSDIFVIMSYKPLMIGHSFLRSLDLGPKHLHLQTLEMVFTSEWRSPWESGGMT